MRTFTKDGLLMAIFIDTRTPNKQGTYPARVRVTWRRKRRHYKTGKSLTPEEWDALTTTKSHKLISVKRDIDNSFDVIQSAAMELLNKGEFSFEGLDMLLGRASGNTLNSTFESRIEELRDEERIGNMLWYDNVYKSVVRFGGKNIPFSSVTESWLNKYKRFLLNEAKTDTTVSIHFRAIRAIMNIARKNGILREGQYPFGAGKFEIQEGEGRKMALTIDQIAKIYEYEDTTEDTNMFKDIWFFIYLCNGINVADLVQLRHSDVIGDEIGYVRQKTRTTSRRIKTIYATITPEMQEIINRWGNPDKDGFLFSFLTGEESPVELKKKTQNITRRINTHITKVGKALNIGKISTYTGRHSFATVLKRSGANIASISESLGHSDLKTTENYLASFEKEERQRNAALLTQFKK